MRNLKQWVVSERSDLALAGAIGAAAGAIAAALKGSVALLRTGFMEGIEAVGASWAIALGPLLGLLACA
jgi:hypothetical protein